MNSKIKFRGKSCTTGQWAAGFLKVANENKMGVFGKIYNREEGRVTTLVDGNTIGISTNATDSHGVEIFEGDILRALTKNNDGTRPKALVMFDLYTGFQIKIERSGTVAEFSTIVKDGCAYKVEIIGNIHDNPKLWKGGPFCGKPLYEKNEEEGGKQ